MLYDIKPVSKSYFECLTRLISVTKIAVMLLLLETP